MKALLLTFDVEEFDWDIGGAGKLELEDQIAVTARGLQLLLPILEGHRARATFYVTGTFARHAPEVVKRLVESGHEIGVHGLEHGDDYASMAPSRAVPRLQKARELVAQVTGVTAMGLRTPRLRGCPAAVVADAGFSYDASPHPTWVPGRYFGLHLRRKPWREAGITKVPISVMPGLRIPVSWLWFQLVGPKAGIVGARFAALGAPYLHLYFHPWEANSRGDLGVSNMMTRHVGEAFLQAIDAILTTADGRFDSKPVAEFVDVLT